MYDFLIGLVFGAGNQGIQFCLCLDKLQRPEKETAMVGRFVSMSNFFYLLYFWTERDWICCMVQNSLYFFLKLYSSYPSFDMDQEIIAQTTNSNFEGKKSSYIVICLILCCQFFHWHVHEFRYNPVLWYKRDLPKLWDSFFRADIGLKNSM